MDFIVRANESLICGICNNNLSVFPIHSHLDWRYVCGRCWSVEEGIKKQGRRNFAYEALAQHVSFLCRYSLKGCSKELIPSSLVLHEATCSYKPIECIHRCGWQDTVDKLKKHFVDKHKSSLIKNEDVIEIVSDVEKYLLQACDDLFVVNVNKTSPNLDVTVVPAKPDVPVNMYNYDVRLHASWSQLVVADDKTQYQMPKHFCFEIDKLRVQRVGMSCQVVVTSKHDANDKLSYLHEPILKHIIVCMLCEEDLVPPIDQCSSCELVICGTCITNCDSCPDCGSVLIRNRAFEDILVECTIITCKFINCEMILSSYDHKKDHEEVCPFRPFNCWKCSFKSNPNQLWKHIIDNHDLEKFNCHILQFEYMYFFKTRNCVFSAELIETQTRREMEYDYMEQKYIDCQISRYTLTVNYCSQRETKRKCSYIIRTNADNCSLEMTYFKINCDENLCNKLTLPASMIIMKDVELNVKLTVVERDD